MVPPETARRLKVTRERIAETLRERDELIAEAIAAGGTLREVGELAGLTHAGIRFVLERLAAL